jgi:ribonuclease Z
MKPSFHPRLINDPFSDPGLFIPFLFQKRAILFDLGDISTLSARDILKISHIFVTHTHMDHFIGFDLLLRHLLGHDKEIHLYGPSGFIKNIEAKLHGYTWNLIENYENTLSLLVTEVHKKYAIAQTYNSRDKFKAHIPPERFPFNGELLSEQSFSVNAALLDHKIDTLGLSLNENFSINILKEGLKELGLLVGPWIREFKNAIYEGQNPRKMFRIKWAEKNQGIKETSFPMHKLIDTIVRISPGQKITYITDIIGSNKNIKKAIELAKDSTHLFIEAPFLDKDKDIAKTKYHLTAKQAGFIGARAHVKNLTLFHFSPRYFGRENEIIEEAMKTFQSS